jgi:hypothetical protein
MSQVPSFVDRHNRGELNLNAILRDKYHGTDLSWSIADIYKKKAELAARGVAPVPMTGSGSSGGSIAPKPKQMGIFGNLFGGSRKEPGNLPRHEPTSSTGHPLVASSAPHAIRGLQMSSSNGSSAGSAAGSPARARTYSILNNASAPRALEPSVGPSVTAALQFPGSTGSTNRSGAPQPFAAPATLSPPIFSPVRSARRPPPHQTNRNP